MRGMGPKRVLGLALGETAIHLAAVQAARRSGTVAHWAVLELTPQAGWAQPQELGRRLGQVLHQRHWTGWPAVVGLPGRWVLMKPCVIPPAPPTAVAGILRLAIEQEYHSDAREWAFDFTGELGGKQKTSLLVAATPQSRISAVMAMLQAAGLHASAVTATVLALAPPQATSETGALLYLAADGVELAVRSGGQMCAVEHLPQTPGQPAARLLAQPDSADALASQIKRVLATLNGTAEPAKTLMVWTDSALQGLPPGRLGERTGLQVRIVSGPAAMGVKAADTAAPCPAEAAAAVALAALALEHRRPAIDFLHSRLAVQAQPWLTRPRLLAAAAAALAILLLGGYFVGDWYLQNRAVNDLQAQLTLLKNPLEAAQSNLDRTNLARGWYDARPPILDCVRDLTLSFANAGQIWATSLTVRDDLTGTLAGKAQDEKAVGDLLDRLRASKRFASVGLLYERRAERNSRVMSFALTFVNNGAE